MPLVISKQGQVEERIIIYISGVWTKVFTERIIHDEEKMDFLVGSKKINLIARMPLDPIRLSN